MNNITEITLKNKQLLVLKDSQEFTVKFDRKSFDDDFIIFYDILDNENDFVDEISVDVLNENLIDNLMLDGYKLKEND